jgi:hypothetical protein
MTSGTEGCRKVVLSLAATNTRPAPTNHHLPTRALTLQTPREKEKKQRGERREGREGEGREEGTEGGGRGEQREGREEGTENRGRREKGGRGEQREGSPACAPTLQTLTSLRRDNSRILLES